VAVGDRDIVETVAVDVGDHHVHRPPVVRFARDIDRRTGVEGAVALAEQGQDALIGTVPSTTRSAFASPLKSPLPISIGSSLTGNNPPPHGRKMPSAPPHSRSTPLRSSRATSVPGTASNSPVAMPTIEAV
jgi:hypothetical protein